MKMIRKVYHNKRPAYRVTLARTEFLLEQVEPYRSTYQGSGVTLWQRRGRWRIMLTEEVNSTAFFDYILRKPTYSTAREALSAYFKHPPPSKAGE